MGDRFVVVPVAGGVGGPADEEQPDAAVAEPAPAPSGGSAARGDQEAAESSVAQLQDHDGFLPILEYNREPNKYGMVAETPGLFLKIKVRLEDFPV